MSRTSDAFIEIVEHCYPGGTVGQHAGMQDRIASGMWLTDEVAACGQINGEQLRHFALCQILHDICLADRVLDSFGVEEINACWKELLKNTPKRERSNKRYANENRTRSRIHPSYYS